MDRMTPRLLPPFLALALVLPGPALALCMASGTGCAEPSGVGPRFLKPETVAPPPIGPGDILPDAARILTNTGYYGLPPAGDGWVYFRLGSRLYRAELASRRILEDVTLQANRAF